MPTNRREFMGATAALGAVLGGGASAATPATTPARRGGVRIAAQHPVVATTDGRIRGYREDDVNAFLGINYGAHTAGANRFLPPQRPEKWAGVRDTLVFGPECPYLPPKFQPVDAPVRVQDPFLLYRNWTPHIPGEDCLRVNVWAPAATGKRPVLVYMHGGGLSVGSGNDLLAYSGKNLAARHDVVVVTHNHRLNLFGYLDLSSFGGRWAQSTNIGMQDIVAVLRWVQDNIAAFGGDPGNVTIFGQSGGGTKVSALLAMPSARGLFHKAIVQSGSPGNRAPNTPDQAAQLARQLLAKIDLDAGSLEQLSQLPAEQLAALNAGQGMSGWTLTVDGHILPETPAAATRSAQGMGEVPLLVGTNLNEASGLVDQPGGPDYTAANLLADTEKKFGAAAADIVAAYRRSYPQLSPVELWNAMLAANARANAFQQAERNGAQNGGRSWQYLFAWHSPVLDGNGGVYHSAEIAFVFDNADLCANQTGGGPDALRLAQRMSDAWVAFARTGNPAHAGLPSWPAFGATHATMVFDDVCRVVNDPEREGRDLIARAAQAGR